MVSYFAIDPTEEVTNFQKEISNMMHGFGDNPNPNPATVDLVENIVLQQLRSMLQEALNYATKRGQSTISNYEIIFLMRKNPKKLKRLYDYQIKLERVDKTRQATMGSDSGILTSILIKDEKEQSLKSRRTHIEIIRELDETDEVSQIKFDDIDYIRKLRASNITELMSFEKYEAYHKARCSSFKCGYGLGKGFAKLEKWVNPNKELKITTLALEVLSFLAYETVAEIVDAVYLIRQDAKKNGDPFSKHQGGYFCNPMSVSNQVYLESGYEGVQAISVAEVREVLRRYFTPGHGMNGLFYRNMSMDIGSNYIAV